MLNNNLSIKYRRITQFNTNNNNNNNNLNLNLNKYLFICTHFFSIRMDLSILATNGARHVWQSKKKN